MADSGTEDLPGVKALTYAVCQKVCARAPARIEFLVEKQMSEDRSCNADPVRLPARVAKEQEKEGQQFV